jgi:small-conductance mechanosensitive channel
MRMNRVCVCVCVCVCDHIAPHHTTPHHTTQYSKHVVTAVQCIVKQCTGQPAISSQCRDYIAAIATGLLLMAAAMALLLHAYEWPPL